MQPAHVPLGHYRGPLDRLLAAIDRASFDGATLRIEGASSPRVERLVLERALDHPDVAAANEAAVERGARRFSTGDRDLRLPIAGDNVAALRRVARELADPEVAMHLFVEADGRCLLDAYDAGDNVIFVSEAVSAAQLDALREGLGPDLRPSA